MHVAPFLCVDIVIMFHRQTIRVLSELFSKSNYRLYRVNNMHIHNLYTYIYI